MNLEKSGIDIFYVDESVRQPLFFATVVRVPFLRPSENGWQFVWPEYLSAADRWRRDISKKHNILFRRELHAHRLLKRAGLFLRGQRNLSNEEAIAVYSDALSGIDFLPERSVFTTFATDGSEFAGYKGMGACMLGLFQRLRLQAQADNVNGLIFFDEGHDEYIHAFRRAQRYLPTGSKHGGWGGKATKNLPLAMFPKDGNIKQSKFSYFVQMADLVAYAARLKVENEQGRLAAKRAGRGDHLLYDRLPRAAINLKATSRRDDGIVPI